MSDVVGGSERKTVCVMPSHFPVNIHVFSLQKRVAGRTEKESGRKEVLSSSKTTL